MSEPNNTRRSVALAEIRDTDPDEFKACVKDMKEHLDADDDTARLIAESFRAKSLPNVARSMGLSEDDISSLLKHGDDLDESEYDSTTEEGTRDTTDKEEMYDMDEEDVGDEDTTTDEVGGDNEKAPEGIAHVKIDLPVEMLPDLKEALRNIVGDEVDTMFPDDIGEISEKEKTPYMEKGDNTPMDKDELEARRAAREAMLYRVAQTPKPVDIGLGRDNIKQDASSFTPENKPVRIKPKDIGLGSDTSFNGKPYVFSDEGQHHDEVEYPYFAMDNSEGNSLREQNPTYNPTKIYTTNPDLLQLKDSYEVNQFTDTPVSTLNLDADLDDINPIPSDISHSKDGPYDARMPRPKIPTQMGNQLPKHPGTAPIVSTAGIECMGCNNPNRKPINYVECSDCHARIGICEDCEEEGYCPSCAATLSKKAANVGKVDIPLNIDISPSAGSEQTLDFEEDYNQPDKYDIDVDESEEDYDVDVDESEDVDYDNDTDEEDYDNEAEDEDYDEEDYRARAASLKKRASDIESEEYDELDQIDPNDPEYLQAALRAVRRNWRVIKRIDPDTPNYYEIALAAVKQSAEALKYIDPSVASYPAIMLAAVSQNGLMIKHIDPNTPNYNSIALAAVRQNWAAIKYIDPNTPNYPQIALVAVRQSPNALRYIDPSTPNYSQIEREAKNSSESYASSRTNNKRSASIMREAKKAVALYKARAKAAYKYSSILAASGVIDIDGIEQNAELWLRDGLSVQAMSNQARLMLRASQTSAQRVAASASNMERLASPMIAFNPTTNSSSQVDTSVTDLKKALQNLNWSLDGYYKTNNK